MAVSTSRTKKARTRPERRSVTTVTFDNSYAEGGEALTASQLGLSKVTYAVCTLLNGSESEKWVTDPWYTPSTSKIHLLDLKTGKELAKETDCSKVKVQVVAYGA